LTNDLDVVLELEPAVVPRLAECFPEEDFIFRPSPFCVLSRAADSGDISISKENRTVGPDAWLG